MWRLDEGPIDLAVSPAILVVRKDFLARGRLPRKRGAPPIGRTLIHPGHDAGTGPSWGRAPRPAGGRACQTPIHTARSIPSPPSRQSLSIAGSAARWLLAS